MSSTVAPRPEQPAPPAVRIVLLRDARWPDLPGVCCWRDSVRTAFESAGVAVTEDTWTAPVGPPRPASPGGQRPARLTWLPPVIRGPAAQLYRGARRAAHRLARMRRARAHRGSELPPALAGASLVIAESIEVATAAIAAGAPSRRMWALALPAERLNGPERAGFAVDVARAAQALAGFLTDSEPARDSLERAAAANRPRTEVFPPLAADRVCPHHTTGQAGSTAREPAPAHHPLHPAVAQLVLWRTILDGSTRPDSVTAHPFAAARLRGSVRHWAATPEPGWQAETTEPEQAAPDSVPRSGPDWSSAAQVAAARRIRDAVLPRPSPPARRPRSALLAGFDLKFARDLAERLGNRTDLAVTVDEWRSLSRGTEHTEQRLQQAESIFAEWARTSAVWYSRRKRPDQFLAVRLHRFELDAPYPRDIEIDNVDAVVYIAPLFGRRIRDELGWPLDKLVYIPNFLDLDWLDRPKLPEARFAIGFVGIEWRRKRFDLALDLLAALRREDPRFRLVVRSTMPWQNMYAWAEPAERDYVSRCFERIDQDPRLRHGVVFDQPGRDMARWFRRVGHVLSTSDEEGCHTAVGEGMASGAVPIVRPWPGAAEIYDKPWIHTTVGEAAAAVLDSADADVWAERGARAKAEIGRSHDPMAVVDAWADLLHGEVAQARTYFEAYSTLLPTDRAAPPPPLPRATRPARPAASQWAVS